MVPGMMLMIISKPSSLILGILYFHLIILVYLANALKVFQLWQESFALPLDHEKLKTNIWTKMGGRGKNKVYSLLRFSISLAPSYVRNVGVLSIK